MNPKLIQTIFACLLHDIGKISGRANYLAADYIDGAAQRKAHGNNGADFLSDIIQTRPAESNFSDNPEDFKEIIEAVRFHMSKERQDYYRSGNQLPNEHILWLVDKADNIAAGVDRREDAAQNQVLDDADDEEITTETRPNWKKKITLRDIFDVFKNENTNDIQRFYAPNMLNDERELKFPQAEENFEFNSLDYNAILEKVRAVLSALDFNNQNHIDSLLNLLEATCSFVPSSTNANEIADISLFDHLKLTAAFGSCMFQYAIDNNITDLHSWTHSNEFSEENIFRLASFDISGIQDFIYTITNESASKQLRARSFYLEIITEYFADFLLEKCGVSRANLLYLGGGHAYFVLPNQQNDQEDGTQSTQQIIKDFEKETNKFLLEHFGTALYVACGSKEFNAKTVTQSYGQNDYNSENYRALYKSVSEEISQKKLQRYDAESIKKLNSNEVTDGRECMVCHRIGQNSDGDKCKICNGLEKLSGYVQGDPRGQNNGFFIVTDNPENKILPIHKSKWLDFVGGRYKAIEEVKGALENETDLKIYAKNKFAVGEFQGSMILVGDYAARKLSSPNNDEVFGTKPALSFDEMAEKAAKRGGVDRLSCLRLDVDDLGAAFMGGFSEQNNGRYNTMSRSATFSRSLSLFFKYHLNYLLENPEYGKISGRTADDFRQEKEKWGGRVASVIYSGGDDVFVVGAWDDVLEFAVELRSSFADFSNSKLTLSAGIGLFPGKYSISQMAKQTGDLEEAAKGNIIQGEGNISRQKDSVTLFSEKNTFFWDQFTKSVVDEKLDTVRKFFTGDFNHAQVKKRKQ